MKNNKFQKQAFADFKLGFLKNFAISTGKHPCWSLFLNKAKGLKGCNSIKKRLQHRCFPVKLAKFLTEEFQG